MPCTTRREARIARFIQERLIEMVAVTGTKASVYVWDHERHEMITGEKAQRIADFITDGMADGIGFIWWDGENICVGAFVE